MSSVPTGTVTFLFTDIEGSTRLWEEHPEAMKAALARHDEILRSAIEAHGGYVFTTAGDAFSAAFHRAQDAVQAALTAQQSLVAKDWGDLQVGVRMALHTGEADERDGDYFGSAVNRTSRLLTAGHGDQVLVSRATQEIVEHQLVDGVGLVDLGEHRLRDLDRPEHVFQIAHPELPAEFPALVTSAEVPNNLPIQVTSFVGRDQEMAEVEKLLRGSRLVTLTGAGGSGKTRLALELAGELLDEFPDGVWLADFASLIDGALTAEVVASSLGVRERRRRPTEEVLADHLQNSVALIVLDNCEHVIKEAATLASHLLHHTTRLRLLATSREPLRVQGESPYLVPTMAAPSEDMVERSQVAQFPAVRLLTERAAVVAPAFRISQSNAAHVGKLCRRLDGLPLAVELAAARLGLFQVDELLGRLEDRFDVLVGGRRDQPDRQQTLHAAFDWSYELLSDDERIMLERLSVFRGGFNLVAAEVVCSGDGIGVPEVSPLIAELASKSLVNVISGPRETRFALLETVRAYASNKLTLGGIPELVQERHADFFAAMAEDSYEGIWGPDELRWIEQLELEHPNLRQALGWYLDAGSPERGMAMAGAMYRFWWKSFHDQEGFEWLSRYLGADPTPSSARARALNGISILRLNVPHLSTREGDSSLREAIDLYRTYGPEEELGTALNNLAAGLSFRAEWDEAADLLKEYLAIARSQDNEQAIAMATHNLADLIVDSGGDYREAVKLAEESLEAARRSGSPQTLAHAWETEARLKRLAGDYERAETAAQKQISIETNLFKGGVNPGSGLRSMARVALEQGDIGRARRCLTEAVRLLMETTEVEGAVSSSRETLEIMAQIQAVTGKHASVVRLVAATDASRAKFDEGPTVPQRKQEERILEEARQALGQDKYQRAWTEGTAMTLDQAVAYALDHLDD